MTDSYHLKIDYSLFKKMCFLYNAIENGWIVKKKGNNYILNKSHGGEKEIFSDEFLSRFINEQLKTPF